MADYYSPTVVQQTIPDRDMTALDRLLLTNIFSAVPSGDGLYFFAEESPASLVAVSRVELEVALAASQKVAGSSVAARVTECLTRLAADETEVELDFSVTSWEFIFQDIVRRSSTLRYVSAIMSFICTKMRPDGFGGMAVLITADRIYGKSTSDIAEEFWVEAGLAE